MPGCPKKNDFLKELKEFLKSQTFLNSSTIKWVLRRKSKSYVFPHCFLTASTAPIGKLKTKKLQQFHSFCSIRIRTKFGREKNGKLFENLSTESSELSWTFQFLLCFSWQLFSHVYRKLRRCGKRLPRFCDVNNDRKITLSEWLNCLQTQRTETSKHPPQELKPFSASQPKLRGPNPLESYLKADWCRQKWLNYCH